MARSIAEMTAAFDARLKIMVALMIEHMIDADARYVMVAPQKYIPFLIDRFGKTRLDNDESVRLVDATISRVKVGGGLVVFMGEDRASREIRGSATVLRATIVFDPRCDPSRVFTESADLARGPVKKDHFRQAYAEFETMQREAEEIIETE